MTGGDSGIGRAVAVAFAREGADVAISLSMPVEQTQDFGAETPMGRTAQPAELAPPYVFLACDESRFVSGEILAVTGGLVTA